MKFIVGIVIAVAMVCGVYTTKSITESIDKTIQYLHKQIIIIIKESWEAGNHLHQEDLIMYLIMIIHTIGMKVPVI